MRGREVGGWLTALLASLGLGAQTYLGQAELGLAEAAILAQTESLKICLLKLE